MKQKFTAKPTNSNENGLPLVMVYTNKSLTNMFIDLSSNNQLNKQKRKELMEFKSYPSLNILLTNKSFSLLISDLLLENLSLSFLLDWQKGKTCSKMHEENYNNKQVLYLINLYKCHVQWFIQTQIKETNQVFFILL